MSIVYKFKKQLDTTTPTLNRTYYQAEQCASICKEVSIGFAEFVFENHKQYPDAILRFDKLFEFYEREQETKSKSMIPPKEKVKELYKKISLLMQLEHFEILEVLDFLVETKTIQKKINKTDLDYWNLVNKEIKKINLNEK